MKNFKQQKLAAHREGTSFLYVMPFKAVRWEQDRNDKSVKIVRRLRKRAA